ncbi:protein-disulfide reductase DsbD family protein [Spirosoma radiotolerans]|uniref:Thiol:disulfide interchange protein DsbD n=1 Tax=Spirosoma radiotolerans TaxID=1379870 RepID=A0A0E3V5E4_9BACT|nr:cytochrome c biogenesis protein CcdA [Spirosoma radiotolerans]AKD53581.1 thiol:disulfide interchange protein DsbD [Spirosoma radiotolerans]
MKSISTLVVWLLLPLTTFAQIIKPVSWTYKSTKSSAKIGDVVEVRFTANIKDGYHIYSSDVNPKIDGPLPTVIKFTPNKTYELVGKIKPVSKVETKFEEVFEGDTYLMHGPAQFSQRIKILTDKPILEGNIDYQVCTDSDGQCIPGNDDFAITGLLVEGPTATPAVAVSSPTAASTVTQPTSETAISGTTPEAAVAATEATESLTSTSTTTANEPDVVVDETTKAVDGSLWSFMLAAFLSGLVALLTPCVFPIIPATVSFFTNQQGGQWKALLYGFFIIGIYVLIGTVVSRFNGPAFANFVSTHWLPNILFFAIFFIFGLSFLGLFEIVLPNSLINQADAKSEQGGIAGIFFMAFTLVLVSFSCTGPIVGSLLVASAGGEVIKPILGMAAFSSAFAIPFTLFAAFPQWLKSLPRSGGWLNSVKVVLGFLELALALKFLSIADQVYHWGLLDREVFLSLWIVIFALIGFYFLGKIRLPHDSETKFISVQKLLLAIATLSFVVYMIPGLWGAPLKALSGYLPPETSQDFNLTNQQVAAPSANSLTETPKYGDLFRLPRGLQGFFDYKQALAYAKKVNKPVFIDFTGHGCVNCREMEARVWSDPAVMTRLQNDFVILALYVDDKTELPEAEWYTSTYDQKVKKSIGAQNADLQITKFNNNAQPHYCLVNTDGKLLVPPKNYDRDVAHFVAFLDSGKAKF